MGYAWLNHCYSWLIDDAFVFLIFVMQSLVWDIQCITRNTYSALFCVTLYCFYQLAQWIPKVCFIPHVITLIATNTLKFAMTDMKAYFLGVGSVSVNVCVCEWWWRWRWWWWWGRTVEVCDWIRNLIQHLTLGLKLIRVSKRYSRSYWWSYV